MAQPTSYLVCAYHYYTTYPQQYYHAAHVGVTRQTQPQQSDKVVGNASDREHEESHYSYEADEDDEKTSKGLDKAKVAAKPEEGARPNIKPLLKTWMRMQNL